MLPDAGSVRLPRLLPAHVAREMLLTGRRMSADEAGRWGLVNRVVPAAHLRGRRAGARRRGGRLGAAQRRRDPRHRATHRRARPDRGDGGDQDATRRTARRSTARTPPRAPPRTTRSGHPCGGAADPLAATVDAVDDGSTHRAHRVVHHFGRRTGGEMGRCDGSRVVAVFVLVDGSGLRKCRQRVVDRFSWRLDVDRVRPRTDLEGFSLRGQPTEASCGRPDICPRATPSATAITDADARC